LNVGAADARRFLVARQLLSPARSLPGGQDAVLEVVRRLGSLQYDPIAVAGRSHDLVLHARVADYDPAWCDALYEQRAIFEAYNKGLSFVPAEEVAWFRGNPARAQRTIDDHPDVAARVLERIRAEGATSSLDFEREPGTATDWFGMPTNTVRALLEAFTVTGVLGLARREGNRRYYDLVERLLPAAVLAPRPSFEERMRHQLVSRYRAHGLLGVSGAGDVFGGIGPAKPDPRWPGYRGRDALRTDLVADGTLVVVTIEGLRGKRFVLAEEAGLLQAPPEPAPTVAFLSPFDPLLWDRAFVQSLFGFHYVWELFLPPEKRRWGWYVLPILFGDRLVGRLEPRIDRDEGCVDVVDVWWEDGFAPGRAPGFADAMRDALAAYVRFAGVERVRWAPHLAAERRRLAG
jgi:uncharacterized protein YcaQ